MAKRKDVRAELRAFALELPGAHEDFPWGESVAKVGKKVFAFLGMQEGEHEPTLTVKLVDSHDQALTVPGAEPSGYGLGRSGWVTLRLGTTGVPAAGVLCDWIEESYRIIAPKKLVAELDARPA